MSNLFIFLLLINAAFVALGLAQKKNMWPFIVLYWSILTAKNLIDLILT